MGIFTGILSLFTTFSPLLLRLGMWWLDMTNASAQRKQDYLRKIREYQAKATRSVVLRKIYDNLAAKANEWERQLNEGGDGEEQR